MAKPKTEEKTAETARTPEIPKGPASQPSIDFSPSALAKRAAAHADDLDTNRGHYVRHAEKGWHYRWFDPRGRGAQGLQSKRDDMIKRGFAPVNGPMATEKREEYVPARPHVEIWRTTDAVMAEARRKRQMRAATNPVWLHMQSCRQMQRGAYVPDFALEMADPKLLEQLDL